MLIFPLNYCLWVLVLFTYAMCFFCIQFFHFPLTCFFTFVMIAFITTSTLHTCFNIFVTSYAYLFFTVLCYFWSLVSPMFLSFLFPFFLMFLFLFVCSPCYVLLFFYFQYHFLLVVFGTMFAFLLSIFTQILCPLKFPDVILNVLFQVDLFCCHFCCFYLLCL